MSHESHRGVSYAVKEIAAGHWQWTIFPPECVKGYVSASGTVAGTRTSAINAARRAIEAQDLHCH
jgi:hypothetical protein